MIEKLAQFLSYAFHPLWIPTYLFAFIFKFTPSLAAPINPEMASRMLLLIFALTGFIPLLTLVAMRLPYFIMIVKLWARQLANGGINDRQMMALRPKIEMVRRHSVIQSFSMVNRGERVIPFFAITVFYLAVCIMLSNRLGWGSFFLVAMMTITGISFIVTLVTLRWKISVHSVAVSSMVGFLLAAMLARAESSLLLPLSGSILMAGAVMSSRLYLNVHTPAQVGYGCLLGFALSFIVTVIYF